MQEKEEMCGELKGTFISYIFDGITRNREALAVVEHFIKKWKVEQLFAYYSCKTSQWR